MSEIMTNGKDRKVSESSDEVNENDLQFKPVVNLPEVQVSTNEENETELIKLRAKLYRFDSSSDPPEWKERGTGDMKLLRHNENNAVRLVMRRDKTLKVCANHFITPWMDLRPSFGSEKAFIYTVAADFADERIKSECLAIKFGTIDNANMFKQKFNEAKNIVLTQCILYNGVGDESHGLLNEDVESDLEEAESDLEDEKDNSKEIINKDGEDTSKEITDKISELDNMMSR